MRHRTVERRSLTLSTEEDRRSHVARRVSSNSERKRLQQFDLLLLSSVDAMERDLNVESVDIGNLKIGNDGCKRDDEFVFMAEQGNSESSLKTTTSMFGDLHDNKFRFSAKKEQNRMNKSRGKVKLSNSSPAQFRLGNDFNLKAKMNVSLPLYVEKYHVRTNESLNKNDECEVVCTNDDNNNNNKEETSECNNNICDGEVEIRSFKCGNDEGDNTSDVALESPKNDTTSVAGSDNVGGFGFTFSAASSSAEVQPSSPKRNSRKKNWPKVGHSHDIYNFTTNIKLSNPNSLSSMTCSPFSGTSSLLTSGQGHKANVLVSSAPHPKTKGDEVKSKVISAVTIADEESCEKWRLRGNQAYKNGNFSVAEDCFTQGLSCVSKEEASQRCRRALMLCYSNRAATRMSLGKMRDALQDCELAAEIEPQFLKVQLRAANCYLALGEVEDASKYLKRCLQSGNNICENQKIAAEASDVLQKTQKISKLINYTDELLQQRTVANAERALEYINEALIISPYSEKLLEMKAETLLVLGRYEEVVHLCDETLGSAEKNSYSSVTDCKVTDKENSQLSKGFYFRLWRCSMILKSYFQLGKLEEGLSLLEEQEGKVSVINKSRSKVLESLIPLAITVRELLHHKSAGNESFQAGRHEEAVEHYTAALSCNVESRPFAAVCFGNRAAAHKALGQITDAIADCNLAIALDGKYSKALCRRATLYEMIRDYDQAASDIRRVVSLITYEDNSNQHGISDRSINHANDLKQNQIWLSEIEEEARKGIPHDMYLILGVEHYVSSSEIKKAYHKAALRHHPDKAGQSVARSDSGDDQIWKGIVEEVHKNADRLFKIIGEAYAILSDPAKRSQYDSEEQIRNSQKKRLGNSTTRSNAGGKEV